MCLTNFLVLIFRTFPAFSYRICKEKKCCLPFQFYKNQVISHCSHPLTGKFRMGGGRRKHSVLWIPAPRYLKSTSKEKFQWSQILAPSHTEKSTKIINFRRLFFVISSDLLMFNSIFFSSKKFVYIQSPPLPLSKQHLGAIWEAVSQTVVLSKIPE